jgi:hypothetical protein
MVHLHGAVDRQYTDALEHGFTKKNVSPLKKSQEVKC